MLKQIEEYAKQRVVEFLDVNDDGTINLDDVLIRAAQAGLVALPKVQKYLEDYLASKGVTIIRYPI